MKIKLLLPLALAIVAAGCNKSGKLAQPSAQTQPTGPVELKVKWPVGERIVQEMDTKMNMELAIPGQPAPQKQDMTLGQEYGLTVLKERPDGGHEVEMEFLKASMAVTTGGKTVLEYDSAKKSSDDKENPVADIFGKIIGSKLQFYFDASNQVERVEGVNELLDRLSSGPQANALGPFKSAMFNKERFTEDIMGANRFLPSKAVQPGDTWPIKQQIEMGALGVVSVDFDCAFQKWEQHGERNCARIEVQGTFNSTPDANAKPTALSMTIQNGDSSGVFWFDPELGTTIDTTLNQDLKMVMKIPVNRPGFPNAPVQMQIITNQMSQISNIKLVSVK